MSVSDGKTYRGKLSRRVAQLGLERYPGKVEVVGSSPAAPISSEICCLFWWTLCNVCHWRAYVVSSR